MRENNCNKTVVIGGWSSAPYGARIVKEGGVLTPGSQFNVPGNYFARASLPSTDQEIFLQSTKRAGSLIPSQKAMDQSEENCIGYWIQQC